MAFKFLKTKTDNLAYLHEKGEGAGYFFLNGRHMSLAEGHAVSSTLYEFLTGEEVKCTFFDYGGWGKSESLDGQQKPIFTLARWLQNTIDLLEKTTTEGNSQVLIGYSMGFWLALAVYKLRPELVSGIVGISPSIIKYMRDEKRDFVPDADDQPLIQLKMAETPVPHPQLAEKMVLDIPVRLIHGMADNMSPYQTSLSLAEMIESPQLDVTLLQGAGHHYEREEDIERLVALFQ